MKYPLDTAEAAYSGQSGAGIVVRFPRVGPQGRIEGAGNEKK
jgi:hypothetical protein